MSGSSSAGRAPAFQAGGREFEPRLPLQFFIFVYSNIKIRPDVFAHVAQSVERFLGKEEVHRFDSGRGLQGMTFLWSDWYYRDNQSHSR